MIGFLLLAVLPTLAAPVPAVGQPGFDPSRLVADNARVHQRFLRSPAWRAFTDDAGASWRVRVDPATGTVHRALGGTVPLGSIGTEQAAEQAVRRFVDRWPALFGVPASDLRLRRTHHDARTDTWIVAFDRLVGGVPLWRGEVTARIRYGQLVAFGADTWPAATVPGAASLSPAQALARAQAHLGVARSEVEVAPRLVVLPLVGADAPSFPLAWELRLRQHDEPGRWTVLVHANRGTILGVVDELRWLDGTLHGEHDTRTVDGDMSVSPLPHLTLTGSAGSEVVTDADGAFSVDDSETWTAKFEGPYVRVTNEAGSEATLPIPDAAPLWTAAAATQAELDSWVFLHRATVWAERFSPDSGLLDLQLRSKVNTNTSCNGYYDGAVNFGVEGDGCNNTARIADVNYHEWGHALHEHSLISGSIDPTVAEAFADLLAVFHSLSPIIAPGWATDGGWLRDLEPDLVYPDDMRGVYYVDQMIYSGAAWDLLGLLQARYGESDDEFGTAWAVSSQLLADAMRTGPDLLAVADEYILADDDDGDLQNGTPHLCEIVEAFALHGLGPGAETFPVSIVHEPLGNLPADTEAVVAGVVRSSAPGCLEGEATDIDLAWSIDGGANWTTQAASLADGAFEALLPPLPAGTVVHYFLVTRNAEGVERSLPAGRWAPYSLYVGELEPIWCSDFSADDGDFTHELADGSLGWDDWEFGEPTGKSGDPLAAYTGTGIWGNDLGHGYEDGAHPRAVTNSLSAPVIDLGTAGPVVVQFRRWLSMGDGSVDVASVLANGAPVWSNHASAEGAEPTEDAEWMLHTLAFDAGESDTLSLTWQIQTTGEVVLGGWNIDDVCVYRPPQAPDTGDTAEVVDTDDSAGSDTASDEPTPDTGARDTAPDCGCASGKVPMGWMLVALAALGLRRRHYGQMSVSQNAMSSEG